MDGILIAIPGVTCYLDDILVVGSSEAEHDERLRPVLKRLSEVGVRLRKKKCEFKKAQVEYSDHVVDAQGLRPAEKKLSAIRHAPEPANVSELKAFLGLLNYYNRFLPRFLPLCNSYTCCWKRILPENGNGNKRELFRKQSRNC